MNDREERIRARAYERWIAEGMPPGREADHWYEAEKELGAQEADGGGGSLDGSSAQPEAATGAEGGPGCDISTLPEMAIEGPKARTRVARGTGTARSRGTSKRATKQ